MAKPQAALKIYSKSLGEGLFELRFDLGPGFRVYFAKEKDTFIILFCEGDKSSQKRDINRARKFLIDYKERLHGHKK